MATRRPGDSHLVHSTARGERVLPARRGAEAAPQGDGIVRIGRTKAGRRGKTVTVVTGLPAADLPGVATELKRLCGSGGAIKDGTLELQGDHRERVAAALGERYRVKLAGG
jgi:translation initiation factor 1